MAYITNFNLSLIGEPDKVSKFKTTLIKKVEKDDDLSVEDIEELLTNGYIQGKLYDLGDWLVYAAKKNPDVLVVLKGDGEESGDMWELRIKGLNFEKQYARIPPFTNINLVVPSDEN